MLNIFPKGPKGDTGPTGPMGPPSTPYVGDYKYSACNVDHAGWLICDGRSFSKTRYSSLYGLIGPAFGSNLSSFALPDIRGRVPGMVGQGAGLTERLLGSIMGTETFSLTSATMPAHTHSYTTSGTSNVYGTGWTITTPQTLTSVVSSSNVTSSTGNASPFSIMQPTLFLGNLMIYSGVA